MKGDLHIMMEVTFFYNTIVTCRGEGKMRVKTSQLVPGCILIEDVIGKSNKPIVHKETVLTEKHITVLNKFLISEVDVSHKLDNGKVFKPKQVTDHESPLKAEVIQHEIKDTDSSSFFKEYLQAVISYKKLFYSWHYHTPIDMPTVRKMIIPLLEQIEHLGNEVFRLHHLSTKEDYLYHHSVSVALLSAYLAHKLGYEKGEWIQVGLAGLLSDCGMARLSPAILHKSSRLTYLEKEEMKKHPEYSYQLVESISTITKEVKLAIVQHHERLDGSGYPYQLTGDKIHSYARIIAVTDTYHAMTCERRYKHAESPFKVLQTIKQAQFASLDPAIVQQLINSLVNVSVGLKVELSNDDIAKIIYMNEKIPEFPIVQLELTGEIVDLSQESSIYIKDLLNDQ